MPPVFGGGAMLVERGRRVKMRMHSRDVSCIIVFEFVIYLKSLAFALIIDRGDGGLVLDGHRGLKSASAFSSPAGCEQPGCWIRALSRGVSPPI